MTTTNIMYAIGSNGSGQLGVGHAEDVFVPRPALKSELEPLNTIPRLPLQRHLAAGGNHTILITSLGDALFAGDSSTGACGQSQTSTCPSTPALTHFQCFHTPTPTKFHLTAATWTATLLTDPSGTTLYTVGHGKRGELAHGPLIFRLPNISLVPDFPPPDTKIVDLAACTNHAVAVLSNGSAYAWGASRKGQCGIAVESVHFPRRIEGLGLHVVRAVCGREFTCLFGPPETGELLLLGGGTGEKNAALRDNKPDRVPGWKDVGASWGGVYVLTGDGTIVSWGRDDYGQLAPEGLGRVKEMAVGSEHVLALSEEGEVTAWGWGEHGNCGPVSKNETEGTNGTRNVVASLKHLPLGAKITGVAAGCATSFISLEIPG